MPLSASADRDAFGEAGQHRGEDRRPLDTTDPLPPRKTAVSACGPVRSSVSAAGLSLPKTQVTATPPHQTAVAPATSTIAASE